MTGYIMVKILGISAIRILTDNFITLSVKCKNFYFNLDLTVCCILSYFMEYKRKNIIILFIASILFYLLLLLYYKLVNSSLSLALSQKFIFKIKSYKTY